MDPIKFFRGYGKVSHHENETQQPKTTKASTTTIIAISAILLLTLIIGLALATVIQESYDGEEEEPTESSPSQCCKSAESIKKVCRVTRYPDSCFSAISSLNASTKPDPETIFKLSLRVAITELSNLRSSLRNLNDLHSEPALGDCMTQFEDALSRLNDSASTIEVAPGEKMLTENKINDIQTWISSAMTDQDTCVDGLEEMGSTVLDQIKGQVQRSKEYISNSLAIIAKMQSLLEKFDQKMH